MRYSLIEIRKDRCHLTNREDLDIVILDREGIKWLDYDSSINLNDFEKVHSEGSSNSYFPIDQRAECIPEGTPVRRKDFFKSLLEKQTYELLVSALVLVAQMKVARELLIVQEGRLRVVPVTINVNKPKENFRCAMRREDGQVWTEAYDNEYQGFFEHGTLKIVRLEPGAKVIGTTTRTKCKVTN